jgi:DMSO/TMAO reductase YedYZ molybdopterin-dependent catalytic subunit
MINPQEPTSSRLPEVEASDYQGVKLVPLSGQGNNAIKGTQRIDKETYRLKVTGLVERELNLSYDQLQELPATCPAWRVGAFTPSGPVLGLTISLTALD